MTENFNIKAPSLELVSHSHVWMALEPTAVRPSLDIMEYCAYESEGQVPRFLETRVLIVLTDGNFLRNCTTVLL